jgi:hypothetical protein
MHPPCFRGDNSMSIVLFLIAIVLLGFFGVRGRKPTEGAIKTFGPRWDSTFVMQVIVSLAVLATSLFIILSGRYTPQDQHWAYASVGTVLGYWLKGK